jgi:serine/threonine protein phosphatase 1
MTINTKYGNIGVVHAESADDWNNNGPLVKETNRWARTRIKCGQDALIENIDMVVVGHTPTKEVLRLANIIYIDTGACFKNGGDLTMLDVHEVFNGNYKRIGRTVYREELTEEQKLARELFT